MPFCWQAGVYSNKAMQNILHSKRYRTFYTGRNPVQEVQANVRKMD